MKESHYYNTVIHVLLLFSGHYKKYIWLALLAIQNAALTLTSSYATNRKGPAFLKGSVVVMSEVVKLVMSLIMIFYAEGFSVRAFLGSIKENIIDQPMDCLKVAIPSAVYFLQNILLLYAVSNLPATVYQVRIMF